VNDRSALSGNLKMHVACTWAAKFDKTLLTELMTSYNTSTKSLRTTSRLEDSYVQVKVERFFESSEFFGSQTESTTNTWDTADVPSILF
jgi:hypothetical protein